MIDESPAQRRLRLYREEKARKNELSVAKNKMKPRRKQELKQIREAKRELGQDLIQLGSKLKEKLVQQKAEEFKAAAAKAVNVAERTKWRLCLCCGDDKDIKQNGMCEQCWNEKTFGIIEPPQISDRQLKSAQCRNVRKGHELS